MRKYLWVGALALLWTVESNAQTTIGIKGGLNIASIKLPGVKTTPHAGIHFGGFASSPISSRFALQPEVLYSQQGVRTPDDVFTYHYVNVPLIFKGTITGGLHVQAGPQFGILLAARRKRGDTSYDITDTGNRYDGAISLGLGYDVAKWQLSGRYNAGVSDTRDGKNNEKGRNYLNNVFQLSLGYKLRQPKRLFIE